MGDELNDWKRQASVSVQVWHLLHLRHRFSPTLFLLFSFWGSWRSGMNYSGENMKVEHKKQKVKREAFDNINFPSCFYQIKRIILLNVLSSSSHPLWASFQTDFLIFLTCLEGACTLPLVSFHWTLNYCFQQLFSVFLYQFGACLWQFSNLTSMKRNE